MSAKVLVGGIITFIGIIYLLGAVKLIDVSVVMDYFWPILIIAIGVSRMVEKRTIRIFDAFIVFIGVVFLLEKMNVYSGSLWNVLWPVLLIIFGIKIIIDKDVARKIIVHEIKKDDED